MRGYRGLVVEPRRKARRARGRGVTPAALFGVRPGRVTIDRYDGTPQSELMGSAWMRGPKGIASLPV